jgi:hypothetical protein
MMTAAMSACVHGIQGGGGGLPRAEVGVDPGWGARGEDVLGEHPAEEVVHAAVTGSVTDIGEKVSPW